VTRERESNPRWHEDPQYSNAMRMSSSHTGAPVITRLSVLEK